MTLTQMMLTRADDLGIRHNYPGPYRVTASPWLNVRQHPSGKIVGKLLPGDVVMAKNSVGNWLQIETGWIHSGFVEAV